MSLNTSQEQSHSNSLHYHRCWWAFCRHSFDSKVELQGHVYVEHIQNARPERLRDVPTHKVVEDDYWDSLDISSLSQMLSIPYLQKQVSSRGALCEPTPSDYIPSSLPSPPASTPHQVPSTPGRVEPVSSPVSLNASPELSFKSPGFVNGPLAPSPRRDFRVLTPTFSSLQSQPNSPSCYDVCIPDSPPFGQLVEEAISVTNSARSASSCEDISGEGSSSQESVFNQLTQNASDEVDIAEKIDTKDTEDCEDNMTVDSSLPLSLVGDCLKTHTNRRSPTSSQSSPTSAVSHLHALYSHVVHLNSPSHPSSLANPTGFGTPMARQSWYQGFRRRSHRRASLPNSDASQSLRPDAFTTSPESCSEAVHPSTPAVVSPVSQSSSPIVQPKFQVSGMQIDSQSTATYPPLLTQAPYHSQDMTQSQD